MIVDHADQVDAFRFRTPLHRTFTYLTPGDQCTAVEPEDILNVARIARIKFNRFLL